MKAQFDKEALIKHRFWICLGVMAPLVLIALIVVMAGASSEIADVKAKYETSVNGLIGVKEPKSEKWVTILDGRDKQATSKRVEIHDKAWSTQEEDFTSWPMPSGKSYEKDPTTLYFGDELTENDRALFSEPELYFSQIDPIIQIVQPVNDNGDGVVQFKRNPRDMIRRVADWQKVPPSTEDVWLAQEDLWVQKGLLKIIREANDNVANLREVKKLKKDDGELQRSLFLNASWQMDLALVNGVGGKLTVRYDLKNLTLHRQFLGHSFRVFLRTPEVVDPKTGQTKDELLGEDVIVIDGEPLNPNQSIGPKEKSFSASYVTGARVFVQQMVDWRSAAVKRIDDIKFGMHSNRTSHLGLQQATVFAKAQPAKTETKSGGGGLLSTGAGAGLAKPGGEGASEAGKTLNGLERNRYSSVTPQVRRMPIGLHLIVDQAYVQDVLTAVANSNMRIQLTQVQWRHYRGPDVRPKVAVNRPVRPGDKKPAPGGGRKPGAPEGGPGMPGGGKNPDASSASDEPSNLVELGIFGIASLYERYPAKDSTDKPSGQGSSRRTRKTS